MKKIPLNGQYGIGKFALIDDEDYEKIKKWNWYCEKGRYAIVHIRLCGISKFLRMHRMIVNAPDNMEVDHKDGDGLNNQRNNLRICTHSQNLMNSKKQSHTATGYKGVTTGKTYFKNPFKAAIFKDNKRIDIGYYKTKIEAAKAYDAKAKELFGEFARLNFPQE